MTLRSLVFLLVFGALAAFVFANWQVFNEPTSLSLLFSQVQAPLGIVMLGFIAVVTVLFLSLIVYLQMSGLLETRRHGKELHNQRQLADQAEASRFTELRGFLQQEIARLQAVQQQRDAELDARLAGLEQQFKTVVEQQANSLSALIAELSDRVEHQPPQLR